MSWKRSIELMREANRPTESPVPRCPKCGSTSITVMKKGFGFGKSLVGGAIAGPVGLLAGGIGANKVKRVCLNCKHQW